MCTPLMITCLPYEVTLSVESYVFLHVYDVSTKRVTRFHLASLFTETTSTKDYCNIMDKYRSASQLGGGMEATRARWVEIDWLLVGLERMVCASEKGRRRCEEGEVELEGLCGAANRGKVRGRGDEG